MIESDLNFERASEFQERSDDTLISHTTILFCRYIRLEWLRREAIDTKTFGEQFSDAVKAFKIYNIQHPYKV